MGSRQKLLNVSVSRIFGEPGTYECRVCGRELDDGRKNYCCEKCRKVCYLVSRMYQWDTVRELALKRDDYQCQACWTPEYKLGVGQLEVDHIVPISQGGAPLDPRNLRTLCAACHKRKSRRFKDYSRGASNKSLKEFASDEVEGPTSMPHISFSRYMRAGPFQSVLRETRLRSDEHKGLRRAFRCPKCSSYVELEDALQEDGVRCGGCGRRVVLRSVARPLSTDPGGVVRGLNVGGVV